MTRFTRAGAVVSRTLAGLAVLIALFLLAGICEYHAYLAPPETPDVDGPVGLQPAPAHRAVLFIVDAFHPEHAFDPAVMPNVVELATDGASGLVRTGPVSLTGPCVFSLMTGRPGNLVQGVFNFHHRAEVGPSLPRAVVRGGRRIVLAGDKAWVQQFGWLAEADDEFPVPEHGATLDPAVQESDRSAAQFVLGRMSDEHVGLLVVHVGSADAVGHVATPYSDAYVAQLRFIDGLIGEVAHAARTRDTILLVTGDHGLGARGSHGGAEEEARITPYVLVGSGVTKGVRRNIAQTAIAPTLAVLLGLPLPVVSEYPPLTDLIDASPDAEQQLLTAYLAAMSAAARSVAHDAASDVPEGAVDRGDDSWLNAALFDAGGSRRGMRSLAPAVTLAAVLAALAACDAPAIAAAGSLGGQALIALGPPLALAAAGSVLLPRWVGANFPFVGVGLAMGLGSTFLIALGACVILWCAPVRRAVRGFETAGFFAAQTVLGVPLLASQWRSPAPAFELLMMAALVVLAVLSRRRMGRWVLGLAVLPLGVACLYHAPATHGAIPQWTYLGPLTAAAIALAVRNLRGLGRTACLSSSGCVAIVFATAWLWRMQPAPTAATLALGAFAVTVAAAVVVAEPEAAATLLVAGSGALFLMMADLGREALVFLVTTCGALLALRMRLDLTRTSVLYGAAGFAVLLRLCLFFQLGDEYLLSGINTAPGFRLVEFGMPLGTVVALLVLKYSLPWLVILAVGLPSMIRSGVPVARSLCSLVALGYLARLAVVGAAAEPLHVITDGVKGLVGLFCISWAEFVTFAVAATLTMTVVAVGDARRRSSTVPPESSSGRERRRRLRAASQGAAA
jgi:hypothetical protein